MGSERTGALARRRALLALLLVAPAPSIGAAAAFLWWPGAVGNAIYAAGKLALYGLPLVWHLLVDRRPLSWSPPRRGGFGPALGLGLALGALVFGVFLALESRVDAAPLREALAKAGIDAPATYLAYGAYLATLNAALEEYAFRWFVYAKLRELVPAPAAVVGAALVFTAHHVIVLAVYLDPGLAALASAGVLAGGLVWSWCYARYGSIWPGWASHALVDVAILGIGWRLAFGG